LCRRALSPWAALSARPLGSRSRGPRSADLAWSVSKPHHVGPSPDVLHAGQRPSPNHTGKVLSPPERFLYYLLDLPFEIQNAVTSFQLELEHLVSRETPRSAIPSLRTFLELSGIDQSITLTTLTTMPCLVCASTSMARAPLIMLPSTCCQTRVPVAA
jgi:hypothetical protein